MRLRADGGHLHADAGPPKLRRGPEELTGLALIDHGQVDWFRARRTTFLLHHSFRYDYPAPIRDLRHRLLIVPRRRHEDQRRVSYRLDVTDGAAPLGALLRERRDRFGNVVHEVSAAAVEHRVVFETWVEVERCRDCRTPTPAAADRLLLDPTRLTEPDDRLRDAAADLARTGLTGRDLVAATSRLVYETMTYGFGATDVTTPATRAFAGGTGVCQDYAHVMIALCRLNGLRARYVSGHLLGEGGMHAWVEVVLGDPARPVVLAYDPTHDRPVGMSYLTVAAGRDYTDVAPTSGTYHATSPGSVTANRRVGLTAVHYDAA